MALLEALSMHAAAVVFVDIAGTFFQLTAKGAAHVTLKFKSLPLVRPLDGTLVAQIRLLLEHRVPGLRPAIQSGAGGSSLA